MKKLTHIAILALGLTGLSSHASAKFFTDFGVSSVWISEAKHPNVPDNWIRTEDSHKWAPKLSAGYGFNENVALKISYSRINNITADAVIPNIETINVIPGQTVRVNTVDDVDALTFGPELSYKSGAFTFTASPALCYTRSKGSYTPMQVYETPELRRSASSYTFAADLAVAYHLTENSTLSLGYGYADLDASWSRTAHSLTASLRINW